jgi:hypothetical protein
MICEQGRENGNAQARRRQAIVETNRKRDFEGMSHMRSAIVISAAILVLVASNPSKAEKPQNPPITVTTCVEHGGAVEQPPGSAIRACCMYSDITGIKGCYVCDSQWNSCVWEPAPKGSLPSQTLQGGGDLSLDPQDQGGSKPGAPPATGPKPLAPKP